MGTTGGIKVFSGNANPKLAEEIARHLGCDQGRAFADRFSDGEWQRARKGHRLHSRQDSESLGQRAMEGRPGSPRGALALG